jgi:hypothetical protein
MLKEDQNFQAKILDMKVMTLSTVGKEEEWRGMRCVNLTLDKCSKLIWGKSLDFVIKKRLNYSIKACWYPSLKKKKLLVENIHAQLGHLSERYKHFE